MRPTFAKWYINVVQKMRRWDDGLALHGLIANQTKPLEILKKQRLQLLQELLAYCNEHVPYYRSVWNEMGFSPQDVKGEADITCLPIITKDILRDNQSALLSDVAPPFDVWKSSGSTGEPFPFRLDKTTIAYNTFGALSRGKGWWGFQDGDAEGMIWSGVSDVSGTFRGRLECLKRKLSWSLKNVQLVDVYSLDSPSIAKGYALFLKHRPVFLRTIASGLYRFCAGLEELGLDGKKLGLKGVVFTGEGLSASQRVYIESVLGCPTICEYGCTELGVIGFECPEGGIHLSHDNLLLEFIKDGYPAKPGELAELVVTNLRNFASPLIRYSVGDLVVPSPATCECGLTLPIIEQIQGRVHDTVVTPSGVTIHGLFFTHLFDQYDQVHQFRVIQDKVSELKIEIVSQEKILDPLIENLKESVIQKFGADLSVSVKQVNSIPPSSRGKTPWIISNVEMPRDLTTELGR